MPAASTITQRSARKKISFQFFSSLENAKKACKNGYAVFDSNGKQVYPAKKSIDEVAREVIQGKWSNGAERKKRLTDAGYDYNEVQKRVNELLK